MFDLDKVYPLHFLVKHLKCYFLKDDFPMRKCSSRQLNPFFMGEVHPPFSLGGNCSQKEFTPFLPMKLFPFSLREHGYGYHFSKNPFILGTSTLGHLAWRSCLKMFFFHPFHSWKDKIIWEKYGPFNPLVKRGDFN